jgi:hypothetical protein
MAHGKKKNGAVRATDPVCRLAPHRARVKALPAVPADGPYEYRRM